MARFIIVGVNDPYNQTPLQPDIIGSSGHKLWSMTGLSMPNYVRYFERVNLWSMSDNKNEFVGRERAKGIVSTVSGSVDAFIICLGKDVARAFGIEGKPKMKFFGLKNNVWVAHLPHPSGLNRWYNSDENRAAATYFMQQVAAAASGETGYDDIFHSMSLL